ncbi:MAG: hypothetical protein ACK53X_05510 [Holosporales bacterium]
MRFGLLVLTLFLLGGCNFIFGSKEVPDPVGIGRAPDALKQSPCACLEVPQQWGPLIVGSS